MIITKTPFRMSFFGGGTDIEEFFLENSGAVISTTFDKYCYVIARELPPFFNYSTELSYSKIERVEDVDKIEHPAIRNAFKMLDVDRIRLTYEADLPARSGLGTSSSFAVGMINALQALKGKTCSKRELAEKAIYLERVLCNEAGGWQDQIAAAYGGLNRINFSKEGFSVKPINIENKRKKELCDNLMLFFTGFTRLSSDVQKCNRISSKEKKKQLIEMLSMVDECEKILTSADCNLNEFGKLLDQSWEIKRSLGPQVSTSKIDEIYEAAKRAGAIGGKLLGAGGGGFLLFYVEKHNQERVKEALNNMMGVPFEFEEKGTHIIHNSIGE